MANRLHGLWTAEKIGKSRSNGIESLPLDFHNCDVKDCNSEAHWVYYSKDVGRFELCYECKEKVEKAHTEYCNE